MKSNKGFTLIELLAVIVILAIIALIATPIILGVIDTAKEGSAKSSALGYIDAVEKQALIGQVSTETTDDLETNLIYSVEALTAANVKVKGDAPKSGALALSNSGAVTEACFSVEIQGSTYSVKYDGRVATVEDCTPVITSGTASYGSAISA